MNPLKVEIFSDDKDFTATSVTIKREEVDLGEDVIILSDEDDDSILCDECGFTTHSENIFSRHGAYHRFSDMNCFTCRECSYTTLYKGDLNIHVISAHSLDEKPIIKSSEKKEQALSIDDSVNTVSFKCRKCKFVTSRNFLLFRHCQEKHSYNNHFVCGGKCPFTTGNRDELVTHIVKEHKKTFQVTRKFTNYYRKKPYKCSKCGVQSPSKEEVIFHMKKIHPLHIQKPEYIVKWFKCGQCAFKASSEENIKKHLEKLHYNKII